MWLEPDVDIHPAAADAISSFDAAIIGPGSFYTSLMPILLVRGAREALGRMQGPVVFVANLLSEGQGMDGMTAADGLRTCSFSSSRQPRFDTSAIAARHSPSRPLKTSSSSPTPLRMTLVR